MSILSFFRRTKSRYADDEAVDGLERASEENRIVSGNERTSELASLIAKDCPTPAGLKRIGKLLGGP
ncbi:MAG: hypothetical protein OJF48_001883 [Afipia sp.]|jgi:hypothetical protein|nr:MAG: hypothetical protein OJF48_001883 [Afipia sp.]